MLNRTALRRRRDKTTSSIASNKSSTTSSSCNTTSASRVMRKAAAAVTSQPGNTAERLASITSSTRARWTSCSAGIGTSRGNWLGTGTTTIEVLGALPSSDDTSAFFCGRVRPAPHHARRYVQLQIRQ